MGNQLIDEITKEVLRRLKLVESLDSGNKKSMLVLSDKTDPLPDKIRKEYHIIAPDLISSMELLKLHQWIDSSDVILITSLTVKQLANLALGCGEGLLEEGFRYALLLGKSIFVLERGLGYRTYRKMAHKTFYRKLLEYEECIKSYGVQIVLEDSIEPLEIVGNSILNYEDKDMPEETMVIDKKLIVEKDLMDLNISSYATIGIKNSCIVTPSAHDYARAHRIRFIKK